MEIKPSEELAYWIGAVQTDGSFKRYKDSRLPHWRGFRISMHTSPKSKSMIERIKILSEKLFKRRSIIWEDKRDGFLYFQISVGKPLKVFEKLDIKFGDPPIPPEWTTSSSRMFGAYLAGVIDGDGSIRKTGGKVRIKISSGHEQTELKQSIKSLLDCWVGIYRYERVSQLKGRTIVGTGFDLEFDVRVKTLDFIKKYLIPKLELRHKKEKLMQLIEEKYRSRIGN